MEKISTPIDYKGLPEYDDFQISIYQDVDTESPRNWDNLGTLVCFGKHKYLGHEKDFDNPKEIQRYFKKENCLVLPVFMYTHGMSLISTMPFSDPWDSGQIGYIYATPDTIVKEYGFDNQQTRERAVKCLEEEIKILNIWLTGDVYRYVIEKDGNPVPLNNAECGTIYGLDECVEEALNAYQHIIKDWENPQVAMNNLKQNNEFFEYLPDREKTPELAEVYLKAGGNLEYVPDALKEEMMLELKFQDGSTMSL